MVELQKDQSRQLEHWVLDRLIDTGGSFAARVIDPGGTTIESPTPALLAPAASPLTINGVNGAVDIRCADAGTVKPGEWLYYTPPGSLQRASAVRISDVDHAAETILFEHPPTDAFEISGTLSCAGVSVAVAAIADVGRGYRVEIDVPVYDEPMQQTETRTYTQSFDVVRSALGEIVTPTDAARFLHLTWPGAAANFRGSRFRTLAERASQRIHIKLRSSSTWPDTVMDREALGPASRIALMIECGLDGLLPPGWGDLQTFIEASERSLGASIREALKGAWVDADSDGVFDSSTETRMFSSVIARRI